MSTLQNLRQRYNALAHAMQSGVAMMMNYDPKSTEPKHLRTGVNSAMVNCAAIAALLIEKGIFTEEEYLESLCTEMKKEVDLYEAQIAAIAGAAIKLG